MPVLLIKEPEIVIRKGDDPRIIVEIADADRLPRKNGIGLRFVLSDANLGIRSGLSIRFGHGTRKWPVPAGDRCSAKVYRPRAMTLSFAELRRITDILSGSDLAIEYTIL